MLMLMSQDPGKRKIAAILLVSVIGLILAYLLLNRAPTVTSFEECVAAGNPIMESYPEQCNHNGKTYVRDISNIPTSADDAPEGSIHILPVPEVVSALKAFVAAEENVEEGAVIILSAYEKDWSDSCLGLGGPAESCLAAITPGYKVTVQVRGEEQVYRTNEDGSSIRVE